MQQTKLDNILTVRRCAKTDLHTSDESKVTLMTTGCTEMEVVTLKPSRLANPKVVTLKSLTACKRAKVVTLKT